MQFHKKLAFGLVVALVLFSLPLAFGQSTTAGDIAGVVTDPTGAVVPGANVTLKGLSTGTTEAATTNAQGYYRFSLIAPGQYNVTVTAAGFVKAEKVTPASIGQLTSVDFRLAVAAQTQTVEITENAATVQTENGDIATTIVAEQLANLPNPGNDLSFVAQLAPGAVMNTQGGYGNFEVFGLPATSNVFTYNGQYDNDPFLNLNNSGATNLLLGQNDVAEVNVVVNGY